MLSLFCLGLILFVFAFRYFWVSNAELKEGSPGFELVSHRGVTTNAPENTIESYIDAVNKGFRWIELDVMCTKDRALVCSHNYDLERETDSFGYIHQKSLKHVKNAYTGVLKGNSGGFRIPTLEDVLISVPSNVGLNIEIKYSGLFDFTGARALCKIKKKLNNRNIIISSFNPILLAYIKIFFGQAPVGFLVESKKYLWITNWLHPDYLHPRADIIDRDVLNLCFKRNLGIMAWTVNSRSAVKWCFNNNVIGVITDRERSTL